MKQSYLILCFILVGAVANAQDSRTISAGANQTTSFTYSAVQIKAMHDAIANHPYTLYYERLITEYEERMKANVKKYKIMAREMQKPQYSDPSYFGHKKEPKKRPVGKRKFCKECEIVH